VNQIGTITSNQVATISPIQTISGGKDNTNVALGTINQESTQTLTQNAYVDAINKVSFFRGELGVGLCGCGWVGGCVGGCVGGWVGVGGTWWQGG
jgi:hypothetical protein